MVPGYVWRAVSAVALRCRRSFLLFPQYLQLRPEKPEEGVRDGENVADKVRINISALCLTSVIGQVYQQLEVYERLCDSCVSP
jgi:hypothetical protein